MARHRLRRLAYYVPLVIALALIAVVLIGTADLAHRLADALYTWTRS
ncbi:MAG: hypothetical protein HOQ18_12815 [Dermatophilaceae bacterium]|nr:hypothetical protein [Dermatophilaceae bacterium]NUQ32971.1 hypothetical protein [Dermatophilaceae bacterium]NUR79759.1 hypothetical protein [Dermatophilaceae bacterium]